MRSGCGLRLSCHTKNMKRFTQAVAAIFALAASTTPSNAITVTSGPTFASVSTAPLAGTLALTTDVPSRISVSVTDGTNNWQRDFFDYTNNHSQILLGFKPSATNEITVTVRDKFRNAFTVTNPVVFTTSPLPTNMAKWFLITNNPALVEPGYTLFYAQNNSGGTYVTIIDNAADVVWYSGSLPVPAEVQQFTNGDLWFPISSTIGIEEANMLGQKVRQWTAPTGYTVDSHEEILTDRGTILYLSYAKRVVSNFPSSATNPNAPLITTNLSYNNVVEISATNGSLVKSWSMIDMLDPTRIDYLCYLLAFYGTDPEHANDICESPSDDSLIVSLRNQDAVVKFARSTGQIKWILGPHDNWGPQWQPYLLTPIGSPFAWNYGQHYAKLTPQGTILMYDDGNERAEPYNPPVADQDNYSRAVEFSIDETNMTVQQVWEYSGTNEDRLYTDRIGSAALLPQTGNVLIDFGYVLWENGARPSSHSTNATFARFKEVTHTANPSVVWDLKIFDPTNTTTNFLGYQVYRAHRIPDLYVHPALPVTDLTVQRNGSNTILEFSGDPVRSYAIQASEDLFHWQYIGAPTPDDPNGDFSFVDDITDRTIAQYYRVVTD